MKKILIIILCGVMGFGAFGQSKLTLDSRARLRGSAPMVTKDAAGQRRVMKLQSEATSLRAFITLSAGHTASELPESVEVQSERGDIVLAQFSRDAIAELENCPAVKSISLEKPVEVKLNRARALSGVDKIHSGEGLPQAYTGKGVLCALVDGGFDPNHVSFLNEDGSSRIENFTYFRPTQSGSVNPETYDADYMPAIDTESSQTYHGTHTMGIMAGGFRGDVTAGVLLEDESNMPIGATVETLANPYYGVATDAALSVACGASTDYLVAQGIDAILNYAWWRQQQSGKPSPVVLNLSMGSNIGPHDGSAMLSKYIDAEVERGMPTLIPVISSGNEGDLPIALHKTFTEGDTELKTAFLSHNLLPENNPNALYGQIYIYSDTAEPFEIQAVVVNKTRGKVAMQNALGASPEGATKYMVSSNEYAEEGDIVSEQLGRYFRGYLGVMAAEDRDESGRYMAMIDMQLAETDENQGNYVAGLLVKGKAGQRIDVYCTGDWFYLSDHGMKSDGFMDGMTDGTISDMATGKTPIVVGSYNCRNYWGSLDGNVYGYDDDIFSNNKVSGFSSYGTLIDGRRLPHVCAPGATIISASNEYFIQDNGVGDDQIQATYHDGTRRYSWHYCSGTSMSAPLVAGSIATWLEADPALTAADALDIIKQTATIDADVDFRDRVKWGAGKFNAYEGLKEVLRRQAAGIVDVNSANPKVLTRLNGSALEVSLPGASAMEVSLYSPSGTNMVSGSASGDTLLLSTSALPKGIYICQVNQIHSVKIVIK